MSEFIEQLKAQEGLVAKLLIGGFVAFSAAVLIILYLFFGPSWDQGYAPEQPIPFSHQVHAGQFNIPCGYCHGSAEYAAHSAVPELALCMNCHHAVKTDSPYIQKLTDHYKRGEPIAWVKVHTIPDFVHFNHRAHVNAGVACETCHGPVQEMDVVYQYEQLTMGWCLNCHRNDDYLQPHQVVKWEAFKEQGGYVTPDWMQWIGGHPEVQNADVSCSTCHY